MDTRTYCLAIDAETPHVAGGVGFLVRFTLPAGCTRPEDAAGFDVFCQYVRDAVLAASDDPFNPDPYTQKVAIAQLMHALEDINALFDIEIGGVPAVSIRSSNPADAKLDLTFYPGGGRFAVRRTLDDAAPAAGAHGVHCGAHGTLRVLAGDTTDFPFSQAPKPPRSALPFDKPRTEP